MYTVQALPWMSIPTVSLFLLELRGYSKLYDDIGGFPHGEWAEGRTQTGFPKDNQISFLNILQLFILCTYVLPHICIYLSLSVLKSLF